MNCGAQNHLANELANYVGHEMYEGHMCAVLIPKNKRCASCGIVIRKWLDLCGDGFSYKVEASVEVPDWPIRQEATK